VVLLPHTKVRADVTITGPVRFTELTPQGQKNGSEGSRNYIEKIKGLVKRGFFNPKGIVSSSPRLPAVRSAFDEGGHGYLGYNRSKRSTLKGLWPRNAKPAVRWQPAATLSGLNNFGLFSQGSSLLATLGWRTESLWDSKTRRNYRDPMTRERRRGVRLSPAALALPLPAGPAEVNEKPALAP